MATPLLSTFMHGHLTGFSCSPPEMDTTVIIPVVQKGKLRFREVK